ncbi:putative WRKY transcription factor 2 [Apostasia shenzhenica]|uniref:Putative WRKY transcription factor 2 n=1 Tax=Apostasia shenzhenica TaxID=1088818 RepID=A0A2I0A730_9ASPA|nr:putative WRKY transcription factor 2 [Apostasia shenzhenica]
MEARVEPGMGGVDDNITIFSDWATSNPSSRTFASNFFDGDIMSRPFPGYGEDENEGSVKMDSEKHKLRIFSKEEGNETGLESSSVSVEPIQFTVPKSNLRGALSERMAARAGFSTLTVNTSRSRTENTIPTSPDVQSSYVLLSPGFSPTTLLESPVFLSNSMAQPSPTTGQFSFASIRDTKAVSASISTKLDKQQVEDVEAFTFPYPSSESPFFPHLENKITDQAACTLDQRTSFQSVDASLQQDINLPNSFSETCQRKGCTEDVIFDENTSEGFMPNKNSPPFTEDCKDGDTDMKGELSSIPVNTPADDGFNWRKYGQKQVKGSEFPRSYYKCTHPNCPVKKQVERSIEGNITEIIYKGSHNHPKPPPSRRSALPCSQPFSDTPSDGSDHHVLQTNFDGNQTWPNTQNGGSEWGNGGMEATSSSASIAEFCDPSNSMQMHVTSRFESSDVDAPQMLPIDEEEDDEATHGDFPGGCDEEEEMDSKRRKQDPYPIDMAASRAVREPRVVVQTTSEVDILDDGYRWRKYGQKVVKGNPNPRSYYKCTHAGCTVRKHVERASHDLKSVITTYEGKHNHDVPTARNSSHANSASSSSAGTPAPQPLTLPRGPEPAQESFMRFQSHEPIAPFGLQAAGFSFGIDHKDLGKLGFNNLHTMRPLKMPVFAQMDQYMEHYRQVNGGFMIPKGEPKEEVFSESDLPQISNSILPLGPQM